MTAPSAISASYRSVPASRCRASGASSAPATLTTVMSEPATPSSPSRPRQASSATSPIGSLKRERTMPILSPVPSRPGLISTTGAGLASPCRRARGALVAGDLELPPGHARHLARRGHEPHFADLQIAQDLRADAVGEQLAARGLVRPRLGDALDQLRRAFGAVQQHDHALARAGDRRQRLVHGPGVLARPGLEEIEERQRL